MTIDSSEGSDSFLGYSIVKTPIIIKEEDFENNNHNSNDNDDAIVSDNEKEGSKAANYSSNSKGIRAQCLVTAAVFLTGIACGMPIGHSATLLPQLADGNGTIYIDREVGSWIASIHSLATPVGSIFSGPLMDAVGRRLGLQISMIPMIMGWLVIGLSPNVSCILIGRILCGLAVGLAAVPAQVLVGEVADAGLRGFLVGGSFAAYCLGILLIYALGACLNWSTVAFCSIVVPVLAAAALSVVCESPAWLIRKNRLASAEKSLLWLRGGDIGRVLQELDILETRAKADLASKTANESARKRVSAGCKQLVSPGVLKPLVIINVFNLLQCFSGTTIIVFYGVDLIRNIGGADIGNYLAAVLTALIRACFSLLSSILLLKMGRRPLALISSGGTAFCAVLLAGYITTRTEPSSTDAYVIIGCLLAYVSFNTIGLMILPGLMIGELFPLRARGVGGSITMFLTNVTIFGVTKVFPMVSEFLGVIVFLIFGISAILETAFVFVALPETKDRTLQEIEDYFEGGNLLWVTRRSKRQSKQQHPLISDI